MNLAVLVSFTFLLETRVTDTFISQFQHLELDYRSLGFVLVAGSLASFRLIPWSFVVVGHCFLEL